MHRCDDGGDCIFQTHLSEVLVYVFLLFLKKLCSMCLYGELWIVFKDSSGKNVKYKSE